MNVKRATPILLLFALVIGIAACRPEADEEAASVPAKAQVVAA